MAGLDERRKKAKDSGKLFLSGGSRRRRVLSEVEGKNFSLSEVIPNGITKRRKRKNFPVEKHFEARVKMRRRQGGTLFLLFPPVGEAFLTKAKKCRAFILLLPYLRRCWFVLRLLLMNLLKLLLFLLVLILLFFSRTYRNFVFLVVL